MHAAAQEERVPMSAHWIERMRERDRQQREEYEAACREVRRLRQGIFDEYDAGRGEEAQRELEAAISLKVSLLPAADRAASQEARTERALNAQGLTSLDWM